MNSVVIHVPQKFQVQAIDWDPKAGKLTITPVPSQMKRGAFVANVTTTNRNGDVAYVKEMRLATYSGDVVMKTIFKPGTITAESTDQESEDNGAA